MWYRGVSLAVLLLITATASGQNLRYVSDELVVNLRTGQSNSHAIVRMLAAGTAVEVLEQNEDSGYSRVHLPGRDLEGWVLTQYLTPEPIARDKLALAERELTQARTRIGELEARVATLSEDLGDVSQALARKDTTNTELHDELADIRRASSNALALRDENETLKRQLADREQEVQQLMNRAATLARRDHQHWFVAGGSVMFGGIVIGLILPRLRRRRRTDW